MTAVRSIHGTEQRFREDRYVGRAHRDLKPSNMLLTPDGTLKVIDFGCSSPIVDETSGEALTLSGYRGTSGYMSPEVVCWKRGDMDYSGDKVDTFACGVILFNMSSGKKPFLKADHTDKDFGLILRGKWEEFWSRAPQCFSDRIKVTIQNLLQPSPQKRFGFEDLNFISYAKG